MADGFNNRPSFGQQVADNALSNFSGTLSTRSSAKYASGARCLLKINGKLVGFAFSVSWRVNTSFTEIITIDDPMAAELAPQRITVDGSLSALHIPGQSATTNNWQPDILSFLFNQYITIEVRDSQTDQLLFFTNRAVIVSRQEEIRVDQLASVSLQWRAIGWQDEKTPEAPKDYDQPYTDPSTKTSADTVAKGIGHKANSALNKATPKTSFNV